jgi:hypothetical protein
MTAYVYSVFSSIFQRLIPLGCQMALCLSLRLLYITPAIARQETYVIILIDVENLPGNPSLPGSALARSFVS